MLASLYRCRDCGCNDAYRCRPRNVVYSFGVSVARTAFVEGPPFSQRKSAMLDPEAKVQRTDM